MRSAANFVSGMFIPYGVCTHRSGGLQRETLMRNVETAWLGRAADRLGENGGGGRREAFALFAETAISASFLHH